MTTKKSNLDNKWKLTNVYSIHGVPLMIKENLSNKETEHVNDYINKTHKCPHVTLVEKDMKSVSYIENNLPIVCCCCGLVGYSLEDFSEFGKNPLYGSYYN